MTSARERELRAAGRHVALCDECDRVFDPHEGYEPGHRTNHPRKFCSEDCRALGRARRRREIHAARREPRGVHRMRREEANGQLPIPGAAEIPERPPLPPLAPAEATS